MWKRVERLACAHICQASTFALAKEQTCKDAYSDIEEALTDCSRCITFCFKVLERNRWKIVKACCWSPTFTLAQRARLSTYEKAATDQTAHKRISGKSWVKVIRRVIQRQRRSWRSGERRRRPDVRIWKSGDLGYMGICKSWKLHMIAIWCPFTTPHPHAQYVCISKEVLMWHLQRKVV